VFTLGINIITQGTLVDSLRVIKSSSEIKIMRESGRIAGRAIVKGMEATRPGFTEHELWATMEYHGKMQGVMALDFILGTTWGNNR
jgi:Xaa-Pro aminopeptidase